MDGSLLMSGSVVAAAMAGTIALFAPCCFSAMLPAYLATSVQNRRAIAGVLGRRQRVLLRRRMR